MIEVTFTCNDCARQEKVLASISSWSYKCGEKGYSQVYLTSVDLPDSWAGIDTSPEKRCRACFEAHKVRMAGIEPEELSQALDALDDSGISYFADTKTDTDSKVSASPVRKTKRVDFNTLYTGPDNSLSDSPDHKSDRKSERRSGRSNDKRSADKRNTDKRSSGRTDKPVKQSVKRNTDKKALKPKREPARKDSSRKPKGKKKGEY